MDELKILVSQQIGTISTNFEEIETKIIEDQRLHHHRSAADHKDIQTGKVAGNPL